MSNSLDPDQDRRSDCLHLGSNCLQKAIGRRQNSPLACKQLNQVNTLEVNILSNIGSFQLRYILPQNALKRDFNGKCIELIEGHYLEVVVLLYMYM